jgi:prolyl-tRNA synthetase
LPADDQALLLAQSRERRKDRTVEATTIEEAVEAASTGCVRIPWAVLGPDGEAKLAEQGGSVRCLVAADGSVPESDG